MTFTPYSQNLRAGDVFGFSGASAQSDFINLVTYGVPRYSISHVGILGDYDGRLCLFESTTGSTLPCLVQGKIFQGTQCHEIDPRLQEYRGKVWHYPLSEALTGYERKHLTRFLLGNIGKPYDSIGAVRSGAKLWAILMGFIHNPTVNALFCSEYVSSALKHVGRFDTRTYQWSPNALIREGNRRGIFLERWRLK